MSRVIYVEWEDSSNNGDAGWHDIEGWDKYLPIRVQSVGRVVFEDDKQLVLVAHWHDSVRPLQEVQGAMRIPKSAIRKRLNLLTNGRRKG